MPDVAVLSRIQFAMTIMFHYIFPPLSIGLSLLMAVMEGLYLKTGDRTFERMARFWSSIFAANFAMGVATGVVMGFQFGTNWAGYARFVGDVFGPALAAEGILAFFLESCFLGVLIFGWDRVPPKVHFFSTLMVALGSALSAVLIVAANSWQQTPAGHVIVGSGALAKAQLVDPLAVLFNPSSVARLLHVLPGAYLQAAFAVMAVCAYYVLRRRHQDFARKGFSLGLGLGLASALAMPATGHLQAVVVARTQPAKLAAFEGLYTTRESAPLSLVGFPDDERKELRFSVEVPALLSLLVHGPGGGKVAGLEEFPRADWPPVFLSFQLYHAMIALGMAFIGWMVLSAFMLWRGKLFKSRLLMLGSVAAAAGPYLANQLGWCAAEVGRQPWVVYGALRTQDAASLGVPAGQVLASIVMFGILYLCLFAVWVYVIGTKIENGPDEAVEKNDNGIGEGGKQRLPA
ncbi:MAG: cytochrome ubiquinol oxidase subunit I [Elusimicrobia bacterium]|nr:cytochrome ubiquinol oxidase subunit I [Elusimicrobiota bacterium]